MANKKISELAVRTPSLSDLMLVGDPSTGYSYKATISSLSTLLEANIALDDLNDVTITSPTAGQVLSYNGTAWVNDTNGITGTGTTNYVPKFTSSSAIGNSQIFDNGTNVGIGTATPTYKLEVSNNSELTGLIAGVGTSTTQNNGGAILAIRNTNNTNGNMESLLFQNSAGTGVAAIIAYNTNHATGEGLMTFGTRNSTGTFGERMRLDASGNLGLGVTNPGSYNAGGNQLVIGGGAFRGLTIAGTTEGNIYFADGTTGTETYRGSVGYNHTSDYLFFYSAANERMRITSGGNVGIGTTSPAYKLDVNGSFNFTTGGNNITYSSGILYHGNYYQYPVSNDYLLIARANGGLIFGTNDTERMRITSGGNVGIGSTTPQSILDITAATPIMTISATTNTVLHGIEWKAGTSLDAFIKQLPVTGEFRISNGRSAGWGGFITFYTDISERMRLTSAGELLINTTTDAGDFKLQVSGNAYVSGSVGIGATSVTGINLYITKPITGGVESYGMYQFSTIQSDVTTAGHYFRTLATTANATFTLAQLWHYRASQTALGASSTVTNQYGFGVDNTLTGATNNYGFFGNIASGTGRWNLYMNGTAANYLAGSLGIGTTSPAQKLDVVGVGKFSSFVDANYYKVDGVPIVGYGGTEAQFAPNSYWQTVTLQTNGSERMRITSSGNVGIGTTTPTAYSGYTTLAINNATNGGLIDFMRNGVVDVQLVNNPTTASFEISSFTVGRSINFLTNGGFERMRITSGGNVLIGSTTDGGQKLQVTGDALISHSAASGTYFEVKRASTTDRYFRVLASGNIEASSVSTADPNFQFLTGANNTSTTGDRRFYWLQNNFSPTSGTATYRTLELTTTINQTGGANGITRGLYVNPTLTAAADWRAIETTQGSLKMADTYLAGSGSLAGSLIDLTQTWNTTGSPTLIKANVTNTASGASSLLMDLQVGGTSYFQVTKGGAIQTDSPTGGTKKPWKLGTVKTDTVVFDDSAWVEVEIDGIAYKLALAVIP